MGGGDRRELATKNYGGVRHIEQKTAKSGSGKRGNSTIVKPQVKNSRTTKTKKVEKIEKRNVGKQGGEG